MSGKEVKKSKPSAKKQSGKLQFFEVKAKAEEKKRSFPQGATNSDDEILSSDKEKPVTKFSKSTPDLSKQPSNDDDG